MKLENVIEEFEEGGYLKKGPWTAAEDDLLSHYVRENGEGNWNQVQKSTGLRRCGKSCRLRWTNHLRPNLKKGAFSSEEEHVIVELHAKLGNKWARMAAYLPGRTDNEIKNYWNTRIKRRQRAGLPLYPDGIQREAHPESPVRLRFKPHIPWPRIPSTARSERIASMAALNRINTARAGYHHTNPFLAAQLNGFKRSGGNGARFSNPFALPHPPSMSPQFGQTIPTQFPQFPMQGDDDNKYNINPQSLLQTSYEPDELVLPGVALPVKSEFPSNQIPKPAADASHLGTPDDFKTYIDLAQENGGLLDDMVQKVQAVRGNVGWNVGLNGLIRDVPPSMPVFYSAGTLPQFGFFGDGIKEKNEPNNVFEYEKGETSMPTSEGENVNKESNNEIDPEESWEENVKKESNNEFDPEANDFSNMLDMAPPMPTSQWEYSGSRVMSTGQSSGGTDNNMSDGMQQLVSSLPPVSVTMEHDWKLGHWSNMPNIY